MRPRGLQSGVAYEVRSPDVGVLGTASGDDLMQDGIELVHQDGSLAHVLVLTADGVRTEPRRRSAPAAR